MRMEAVRGCPGVTGTGSLFLSLSLSFSLSLSLSLCVYLRALSKRAAGFIPREGASSPAPDVTSRAYSPRQ